LELLLLFRNVQELLLLGWKDFVVVNNLEPDAILAEELSVLGHNVVVHGRNKLGVARIALGIVEALVPSVILVDVLDLAKMAPHQSPPTPPAPLSQSVFPCLVDDFSLPEPRMTVGPGGRPRHMTLNNGSPRRELTVYERGGVLQFPLVKGIKIKVGIIKKHLARIPDARKSQGRTVSPLLGVSTVVLFKDEYAEMAREMYPTSKDQQTATKNLGKNWCSLAMTSHPKISKTGTYTLTFDPARFRKNCSNLMVGGNLSAGRPNIHIVVVK